MSESDFTLRSRVKFSKLLKLREERKHCDVIFVGDNGHEFYCHKIILSLATDVFDASYNFKPENKDIIRIKLKDLEIKEEIFKIILDVIYMSQPTITPVEAFDLLFDADKLLMDDVVNVTVDQIVDGNYLAGRDINFLVRLCTFPGLSKCHKLLHYVKDLMALTTNFLEVSRSPDFYKISVQDLCSMDILKKADNFGSPETCVDFIGKWIMYDVDSRIADIETIAEYLNSQAGPTVGKFLIAFSDVRKNNKNLDTIVSILKVCLTGLLFESIRQHFEDWKMPNTRYEFRSPLGNVHEKPRVIPTPKIIVMIDQML